MRAMKKATKRMIALFLTAIMTLAMAATSFATMTEPMPAATQQNGNLTVKVNEKNTLEGQTIKLYKLFDLSVSGSSYAYVVNDTYKNAIATALGIAAESATSEDLYNKLAGYTANSAEIQKFADDFTAAALTAGTAATETSEKLGKVTERKFTGLAYGYYLVYQTGTKEIQSSLVSVDKENAEVNLKGEAPSIEKTADAETVEIGQVVTYTITGTIPDTTGYDAYVYKIKDTLTNGLDFVKDADGTVVDDPNNYSVSVKIGESEATNEKAVLSGDNNRTMTLDLSAWIQTNQNSKGQQFTVTYYAKVNSDAVVTEKNSASLEYGNNPEDTTTTTPSEAKTPTYPLNINKIIKDNKEMLKGATFRLYKDEADAKAANDNAIKVTKGTLEGSYTVAEDQNVEKNMDMVTAGSAVDAGYNLHLNGLAAGIYWLVETDAPAGYNKLTAPIKVTITKSTDTDVNNWELSKDDTSETDKIIDVENSTGTLLPETGGMGTVLFTVVAVVMILGVAISFIRSRKIEE